MSHSHAMQSWQEQGRDQINQIILCRSLTVFLILTQKSAVFFGWHQIRTCSGSRIPPENCSISDKSLSFREAFPWASFCLSEVNHRAESARTVTHLQECDLAMSWLPSGQTQGATWGLSQAAAQETAKKNWEQYFSLLASLWTWEELLNGEVHNPITVSEMRCTICENRLAESPFQLLRSLSCYKEEEEGRRASCLGL